VSQSSFLPEAWKAQEQIVSRHTRGKVVLKGADEPQS
jgi:hypothetical protein